MNTDVFKLIEEIAERNGAVKYYPLEVFTDGDNGESYLTCDNGMSFPECSAEWMFSDVSDKEATALLTAFMRSDNHFTYEILCHLSRLMAVKGLLVSSQMDDIVATTDWSSYASKTSLLSYLAVKPDGVEWILRLLDVVPNDARDGLFTACWYCNDAHVQTRLFEKFDEWIKSDPTWGGGDRENAWLKFFLGKWISEGIFPYERLKNLVVWHFRHEHRFL